MTSGHLQPVIDAGRLVEQLADAVIVADERGAVLLANSAAARLVARPVAEIVGGELTDLMPPRFRPAHLAGFARYFATGRRRLVGGPPIRVAALRSDGAEVAVELSLAPLDLGPGGLRAVVATLRDVTDRVELEREVTLGRYLRAAVEVALRLQSVDDVADAYEQVLPTLCAHLDWDVAALWLVDESGQRLHCTDVWTVTGEDGGVFEEATRRTRFGRDEGLPGTCWQRGEPLAVDVAVGDIDLPRRAAALQASLTRGLAFPLMGPRAPLGVVEMFRRDAAEVQAPLLDLLGAVGRQLGQFLARVRVEAERVALVERLERAQRSQLFLLHASEVLAEATGYAEILERLAAVAVPTLGDICIIDVVGDDGRARRMAARHADPARQHLVDALRHDYPPDPAGGHPAMDAINSGRSRWSAEMSPEFLRETTRDDRHLRLVTELHFDSYVTVPLVAEQAVLGAVTLVCAGSGRRFGPADVALAEELAGRVAQVVANARRYDAQSQASHTLQGSLLPQGPLAAPGLTIATRYLPGTRDNEVGGDFYDVLAAPTGAVAVTIGDVAGHDLGAAAMMGRLRSAIRALVKHSDGPASLLRELHDSWDILAFDRIATVTSIALRPGDGRLRVASAGHMPPLLVHDGQARLLPVEPAGPLGAPPTAAVEWTGELPVGAVLVVFTDGLVEDRHQPIDAGLTALVEAAEAAGTTDPELLCDRLLAAMVGEHRGDDVAVLALRREPPA